MGTNTSNHSYDKPDPGGDEDVWGQLLNDTIDALDVDVILKGELANRPDPGTEDRWFMATDESPPSLFYDDGSSWVTIWDGSKYVDLDGDTMTGILDAAGGLTVETRTDDPSSPEDGRIWLRTDL